MSYQGKFKVTNAQIDLFISLLLRKSAAASISGNLKVILENLDGNIVLLTAVNGRADYIVSGDKHLLMLRKIEGVDIGHYAYSQSLPMRGI